MVLIGLVGGVAMGAVAAARRTQSSFPAFLASTNPSDLSVGTAFFDPAVGSNAGYDPAIIHAIARLPHVKRVATYSGFNANVEVMRALHTHGHVRAGQQPPALVGSVDGEYSAVDRVTVTQGRPANPNRVDEAVMSAGAARAGGLHVGSVVPLGFFTNAQLLLPDCCSAGGSVKPHRRINLRVVGIALFNNEVVQDDIDSLGADAVLFTPALVRQLRQCCATFSTSQLQLDGGSHAVAVVNAELGRVHNAFGALSGKHATSVIVAKAERAIKPEAIALGVFGGIAALAAVLIAAQIIGRQVRQGVEERDVLRALGAGPAMTVTDPLIGIAGAVVIGAVLAGVVAVGLSPLAPLGPVRPVNPSPGIAFDWTVLGVGVAVLIVALSAIAVASAYRQAPHRPARQRQRSAARGSRVARAAASSGLSAPVVTGIRFALEPGAGRNPVPVRSAILGAALAVIVVVGTVTFGASLNTLVSHPALYGWNWNYALLSGYAGNQDLPQHQTATLLDRDPYVAAWTGVYFVPLQLDGHDVGAIATSPHPRVAPPLLSGHGLDTNDQVVLGATTLAQLHKRVGDTVVVRNGITRPTRLRIVGTATLPTIGTPGSLHPTMGTGALFSSQLVPAKFLNVQESPVPGPHAVFIRIRHGANPTASLRSLEAINAALGSSSDGAGGVVSVQRPAEIVNYHSQQSTPAFLGAALAAGAMTALAFTLIASVRRRRRDLALLKTLGFTRRQLAAVVAWQSSIAVAIGTLVGVPLGIIVGRSLWDLFAHGIDAVPQPTIPTLTITLIAIGALALANLVATIPARQAARSPTALLLRAE